MNEDPKLNEPKRNVYSRPDLQAWRQVLTTSASCYKVIRQVTNRFDDKGRPYNKEEIQYIPMTIIPNGDYSVNRREQGSWTAERFTVAYVYPDYLRVEDIIEHPNYGRLRILSINDMREYGVSSASAVRIDSIREVRNSGEWL